MKFVKPRKVLANAEKMSANPDFFGGDTFLRHLASQMQSAEFVLKTELMKLKTFQKFFTLGANEFHLRLGSTWTNLYCSSLADLEPTNPTLKLGIEGQRWIDGWAQELQTR